MWLWSTIRARLSTSPPICEASADLFVISPYLARSNEMTGAALCAP